MPGPVLSTAWELFNLAITRSMNATIITILKVILVIYDCVAKISWLKITDIYFLIVFVGQVATCSLVGPRAQCLL